MNTNTKKIKGAFHGECIIFECPIPKNAKKIKVGDSIKIADSENSGNHHLIENPEGCEFYELDGIRYMRNTKATKAKCVIEERHSSFEIPPGDWSWLPAQEYDYYTQSLRNVAD